jgi:anti-anti-sigma factor
MKLSLQSTDADVMCLQCEGKITQTDFKPGADLLIQVAGNGVYARRLLIDLSRCDYMDSSGIGWLVTCHKRFKTQKGRMVLHSLPPMIMNMLRMLKMEQVFAVASDLVRARETAMEEQE